MQNMKTFCKCVANAMEICKGITSFVTAAMNGLINPTMSVAMAASQTQPTKQQKKSTHSQHSRKLYLEILNNKIY